MNTQIDLSFEKCLSASVINLKELRKLSWNGIPRKYRAISWKLMLGYIPTNKLRQASCIRRRRENYWKGIQQHYHVDSMKTFHDRTILDQVLKDVPRTAPQLGLFSNERILASMERILFLWATRNPASSYVQGINDLVTPFFVVFLSEHYDFKDMTNGEDLDKVSDEILFQVEADCYGCLFNLLSGIQDHYTPDQPGIHRMVAKLEEHMNRHDSALYLHLQRTGLKFLWFAFKWMNCFLIRELPLGCIIRMWDTYFSEDNNGFEDFHVYVCATLLQHFSETLKGMDFDNSFEYIQNLPTAEWGKADVDSLLSKAHVMRHGQKSPNNSSIEEKESIPTPDRKKTFSANVLYELEILLH